MSPAIWGVGTTSFAKQPHRTAGSLVREAVREAFADAEVTSVDAVYAGTVFGAPGSTQRTLQALGVVDVPIVTVENACATGTTAFHEAAQAVAAGRYERVLALGLETMTTQFATAIVPEDTDRDGRTGLAMPGIYAMAASRYVAEFGVTPQQLAAVAVKNRQHGAANPRAQHRNPVTTEDVLSSRMIADPLTLLQCCSISDAAAAAVIGPPRHDWEVRLRGSALRSGSLWDHRCTRVWGWNLVNETAEQAYRAAGIVPQDADLFEVHDAFTIGEIVTVEALGLAKLGEGARLAASGASALGGRCPVNPSGGLLARGHPLGATGLAQVAEVVWQLRGRAEAHQVDGARIAVIETMGGRHRRQRMCSRGSRKDPTDVITKVDDNLLSPANVADPYPALAQLLAEGPVRWSETHGAWMVLGHDALLQALRVQALSSDRVIPVFEKRLSPEARQQRAPTYDVLRHWMVFNDPPNHIRLRTLVSRAFTARAIDRLKPRIEQIVSYTLDGLRDRETVDLIRDFAFPIPAMVIAEFLAVPTADRDLFKEWSEGIMVLVFGGATSPGRRERGQDGLLELGAYLRSRIAVARFRRVDNLLGMLMAAREGDDTLTEDEIVATCTLLLFAGHETTTNLIGNGTRVLLEHPAQLARFRADPGLTQGGVEEILRFDGPSKVATRRVAEPVHFAGYAMREGQQVLLVQAAANRDPEQFENPAVLDLTRSPNRHVGFGFGVHHCLGASLARIEGAIALRQLFERFPALAPEGTNPTWHPVVVSRGMSSYRVNLGSERSGC